MKRKFKVFGKEYTATLVKDDDVYFIKCPRLHSFSEGRTIKSALRNIKEATELKLETDGFKRKEVKK